MPGGYCTQQDGITQAGTMSNCPRDPIFFQAHQIISEISQKISYTTKMEYTTEDMIPA